MLTAVPGLAQNTLEHHGLFGCGEFGSIGVFEAGGSYDPVVWVVVVVIWMFNSFLVAVELLR